MSRWLLRRIRDPYEELRARMIAETSAYLTLCLQRPELAVHIPTIPANAGRFPRSFAAAFWEPILSE
jgi:hypothetical protein